MFTENKNFPYEWTTIESNYGWYLLEICGQIQDYRRLIEVHGLRVNGKMIDLDKNTRNALMNKARTSTVLAGCYSEAVLNLLFVVLLGEKFYEETLEQNRPLEKLKVLHLLRHKMIPHGGDNDYRLVKELIKKRNDLVHNKASESPKGMLALHTLISNCDKDIEFVVDAVDAINRFAKEIFPQFALSDSWDAANKSLQLSP